jgi:hypothetical protein
MSAPARGVNAPVAFPTANRFCVARLLCSDCMGAQGTKRPNTAGSGPGRVVAQAEDQKRTLVHLAPRRCSHLCTTLYVSSVMIPIKYTGARGHDCTTGGG